MRRSLVGPIRSVALAVAAGLAVGAYLGAWLGWPGYIAVVVGAIVGLAFLVVAASLGEDPAAADAAWREAAADLYPDRPAGPGDAEPGT